MTLRVLFLGDHLGYAGDVVHGATTYYLNVLPRLREQGVDARCCFLRAPHSASSQLQANGVPVTFLSSSKWGLRHVAAVEALLREMQADVLHVAGMKSVLIGRWLARRLPVGLVIHVHDLNIPPLALRLLYRLVRLDRERAIAVSKAAAALMPSSYAVDRAAIDVLYNGIDIRAITDLPSAVRPAEIPAASLLMVWVGRFHPVKGPKRMVGLMPQIRTRVPGLQLAMIGDGPEREACIALAKSLQVEACITFLGQRGDVAQILRHADLMAITSRQEGFPFVAVEAAVAGVPVVAFNVGGLGEAVLDQVSGILVPDGEDETFVGAVVRLATDAQFRDRLSAQARHSVERLAMDGHVSSLIRLLEAAKAPASLA
ncbi:MAG: glycosyltransferase family 4 protein [Pseudomonadota bacterium]